MVRIILLLYFYIAQKVLVSVFPKHFNYDISSSSECVEILLNVHCIFFNFLSVIYKFWCYLVILQIILFNLNLYYFCSNFSFKYDEFLTRNYCLIYIIYITTNKYFHSSIFLFMCIQYIRFKLSILLLTYVHKNLLSHLFVIRD